MSQMSEVNIVQSTNKSKKHSPILDKYDLDIKPNQPIKEINPKTVGQ